jgi:hypothetical protein
MTADRGEPKPAAKMRPGPIDLDAPSGAFIRVRVPPGVDPTNEEAVLAHLDRQNANRVLAVIAVGSCAIAAFLFLGSAS